MIYLLGVNSMKLHKKRRHLSMTFKLIILCLICILLPMYLLQFYWASQYIDNLNNKKKEYLSQAFDFTYQNCSSVFLDIIADSNRIVFDPSIKEIVGRSDNAVNWQFMRDIETMDHKFLQSSNNLNNLKKFYTLIAFNGRSFGNWGTLPGIDEVKTGWLKDLDKNSPFPIWIPMHESYLSYDYGSEMISMTRTVEDKGYLRISIYSDEITKLLQNKDYASIGIIDKNNNLLYQSNVSPYIDYIKQHNNFYSNWSDHERNIFYDNDVIFISQSLPIQGWTLFAIVDEENFNGDIRQYTVNFIVFSVMMLIVFIIIIICISYKMIKPLNKLKLAMAEVGEGNWDKRVEIISNDEVGAITEHFNRMVQKIKELVQTVKDKEVEKTKIYYESLMAQINPHFLYNSINSIKWAASLSHATQVYELLTSLGVLLEMTTSRVPDIVSLEKEIDYVIHYMNLQHLRFGEKVTLEINVPDKLKKAQVPKFILQPFVENSIIHGFEQHELRGKITIDCKIIDNDLNIYIKDNGKGIEKKIEEILAHNNKSSINGIGIHGIVNRIQLLYGDKYGIKINSIINEGTTVHIHLPFVNEVGDNNDV